MREQLEEEEKQVGDDVGVDTCMSLKEAPIIKKEDLERGRIVQYLSHSIITIAR